MKIEYKVQQVGEHFECVLYLRDEYAETEIRSSLVFDDWHNAEQHAKRAHDSLVIFVFARLK